MLLVTLPHFPSPSYSLDSLCLCLSPRSVDRVGSSIKDRIVVRYVNDFGEDEAGIDIGGLFKDFWTDLSARVFNPSFGLFAVTASQVVSFTSALSHHP
jgi:hypothetical protein